MAEGKNYYQILGVDPFISQRDLKIHFRRIIKLYHPDLHQGAGFENLYREILEAYDVLSDPGRRFDYDHTFNFGDKSPLYGSASSYTYGSPSAAASNGRYSQTTGDPSAKNARSRQNGAASEDPSEFLRKLREERKNKRPPQKSFLLNGWVAWTAIATCALAVLWMILH